ncbi:hypothetical protein D0T49_00370 [Paludibacter sp. 221]|uniref:hypothetical protein n=1 Tax=Paludibacter sp. 221 TaxID=2302939 RepID=UPI0013D2D8C8|nr:hypothetical protein [Paludibacter sp. 221]NDV45507.1 hypothetical protein [Paludibacter sp. 221]
MYDIGYDIQIGKYRLGLLQSVEINKSVDLLAQTAVIVLPGVGYNQTLDHEQYIKAGDPVTIKFGYDDELVTEFEGYVRRIDTDDDSLTINCEDSIYLTRKAIAPKEFVNCKVRDVAAYCAKTLGFSLDCTIDTEGHYFDKFTISPNDTVFNVLSKLKEATKGQIYITGNNRLNVHPPYIQKGGDVVYNFAINIEVSSLKYRNESDRLLLVVANGVGADGKKIKATAGKAGGDVDKIDVKFPISQKALQQLANNQLKYKSYTGYEGNVTSWLIPYVEPTWSARIVDKDYEYKEGVYYVMAVKTELSESGGVRTVELGRRLAMK